MLMNHLDLNKDGVINVHEFYGRFGAYFTKVGTVSPQQIHLALTGNAGEMRVTWVTRDAVPSPQVIFASEPTFKAPNTVQAVTSTYQVGTYVPWVGWIHTAVMKGLAYDSTYYYRVGSTGLNVGSNGGLVFSSVRSFKTENTPWWTVDPFQRRNSVIAVYGDMGTLLPFGYQVSFQLSQDDLVKPYELVVHAGDIAYAGTGKTWEFEFMWDLFGRQVEVYADHVPYMTAVGNHEHYFNYTSYNARFQMPSERSGGYKNFWLSFDHTYAHWIFMSTEHDYTPGSEQYQWLEADLAKANANRGQRPWIFLVGHRPMFCSVTSEYGAHSPGATFQKNIEPLMLKWGVDVYWSGHEHLYERMWPTKNGTVPYTYENRVYNRPGIPTHVVIGSAGAFVSGEWTQPRPAWSAFREQQYGYGRLTLNATAFHWEYLSTNIEGVRDEFWLVR